jgi:hypothetical protein
MNQDRALRDHLVKLLQGGQAHCTFDEAVKDMPTDRLGATAPGMPHSSWQLLEHLRVAQKDILDFSRDPHYKAPRWPDDYWPASPEPPTAAAWDASLAAFRQDLKAMCDLVLDPAVDLFAPIKWGEGQTVLREAMLVADHNAYHLSQLVTLRRILGTWSD